MTPNDAIAAVKTELKAAIKKHPPMASLHEGYAIILEEMDEVWDEIKRRPKERDADAIRNEMVQIAAMSVRFLMDLT